MDRQKEGGRKRIDERTVWHRNLSIPQHQPAHPWAACGARPRRNWTFAQRRAPPTSHWQLHRALDTRDMRVRDTGLKLRPACVYGRSNERKCMKRIFLVGFIALLPVLVACTSATATKPSDGAASGSATTQQFTVTALDTMRFDPPTLT